MIFLAAALPERIPFDISDKNMTIENRLREFWSGDISLVAMGTVKSHIYSIYQKIGVKNRAQLIPPP